MAHVDAVTVIAVVMMVISGALALQRHFAPEPVADMVQLETVRLRIAARLAFRPTSRRPLPCRT